MDFEVVGETVKVFWESEQDWFSGVIDEVHPSKGYHVQYFDGDDEWIKVLDKNVEFERKTQQTKQNSFDKTNTTNQLDETELQVVSKIDAEKIHPTHFDDYESHQDTNRLAIISDLFKLSDRGVLLVGSVLSFLSYSDSNEKAFFKVLFVEGGSQPAMFRCKTPIYTSDISEGSSDTVAWRNAKFRFDMVMPETPSGLFKMQGEIIIGVYVSRANGSNEMIGQTSIDLSNLAKLGTVECFREGVDGRSVTGGYPLVSPAKKEVGELRFQLNIAWLTSSNKQTENDDVRSISGLKNRSSTTGLHRPASAGIGGSVAARTKAKSTTGSTKKPPSGPQVGSDGVAKVFVQPARKIVSAISRKQKEDAARIERENKKLTSRLQTHSTKHSVHMEAVYTGKATDNLTTAPVSGALSAAAEAKSKYSDDRSRAAKSSSGAKGSGESYSHEELLKIYNDLKRSNTEKVVENQALKANLTKITTHVKKFQMQIERIKGRNSFENSSSAGSVAASQTGAAVRTSINGSYSGSRHAQSKEELTSKTRKSGGPSNVVSSALMDTDVEITDIEHQNLADEYTTLQAVRRGLVERIAAAKKLLNNAHGTYTSTTDRQQLLKQRVAYYTASAPSKTSSVRNSISREAQDKHGATPEDPSDAPVDMSSDDYVLFERLKSINLEVLRTEAVIQHGIHTLAIDSQVAELSGVGGILKRQADALQEEIDTLKKEKLRKQELLQTLVSSDTVMNIRQFILHMNTTLLTLQRNERLDVLDEGYRTIELELLRLKLRQKERKEMKRLETGH